MKMKITPGEKIGLMIGLILVAVIYGVMAIVLHYAPMAVPLK
jgi:hypothetical protein